MLLTIFLPKIWLTEAIGGWKTVEAKKNEVPAQKASIVVPPRRSVIIGNATLRDVESNAEARVMIESVIKIM